MNKRLLAVDCDLTVCPSDVGWWNWLRTQGQQMYSLGDYEPAPYHLGTLFPTVEDPYVYWRELDYMQFEPIAGSVEALEKLSQYFGIVFLTQGKGVHGKSKYYWLEKHFPFMQGVMITKEKYLMNNSVVAMIDDRLSHLKGFDYGKRILFETPYTQDVECEVALTFSRWNDLIVKQICEEYLK